MNLILTVKYNHFLQIEGGKSCSPKNKIRKGQIITKLLANYTL